MAAITTFCMYSISLALISAGLNCNRSKDGCCVVLAVEKRITSLLLEPSSVEKVMEIDEHIGCAMSGSIADACTLVEHARAETQNHIFSYGEPMIVESATQAICDLTLRFGEGDEESMEAVHRSFWAHFGNAMPKPLAKPSRPNWTRPGNKPFGCFTHNHFG